MKRNMMLIGLLVGLTIALVGCSNSENNPRIVIDSENKEEVPIEVEESTLTLDIKSNSEDLSNYSVGLGTLEFTPIVRGDLPENIQYHWIIDNPANRGVRPAFEMFHIKEGGGSLEVINNGEPVEFGVFAEISYANNLPLYFDIILKVEDISTLNVIAEKKILIENRGGRFKIIREEMTAEEKDEEVLKGIKDIVFKKLPKEYSVNLDEDISKAQIEKVILREEMGEIVDSKYIGTEVYVIDFKGKDSEVNPNNKIAIVESNNFQIIGYGYID